MMKSILLSTVNLLEKKYNIGLLIENRYEIIHFLGRGSYGSSYLVYDRIKKRKSVLKLLRVHKKITKKGQNDFEKEQLLLQSLDEPFFPKFFETGEFRGTPFFTMEYINGKTFEQLIFEEGNIYSEKESFTIVNQLLNIIELLHQKGIVHRDIRIPNVMLENNQLKLIDFGLARQMDRENKQVINLNDIKRAVTPISDFYALGHFLLFLLYSNYHPIANEKEKSWEEELNLSQYAKNIIKRLLAIKEPYQSCKEIQKDLTYIIN